MPENPDEVGEGDDLDQFIADGLADVIAALVDWDHPIDERLSFAFVAGLAWGSGLAVADAELGAELLDRCAEGDDIPKAIEEWLNAGA